MKTCLILSGTIRTMKKCINNLIKNVIEPNDCDVFFICECIGKKEKEDLIDVMKIEKFSQKVKSFVNVEDKHFSEQSNYFKNKTLNNKESFNRSSVIQFFKLELGFKYMEEYEEQNNFKYDFVIKLRPDISVELPIKMTDFNNDFILSGCDLIILGRREQMICLKSFGEKYLTYYPENCVENFNLKSEKEKKDIYNYFFIPESQLYTHYKMNNIKFIQTDEKIKITLIR